MLCSMSKLTENHSRREDARDAVLIKSSLASKYNSLSDLPAGAVVGTSAVRRSAQIRGPIKHTFCIYFSHFVVTSAVLLRLSD